MKYAWEQLTIHLVESCTKGQHPQQNSSSLLMVKHCSGGDRAPHSGPAKWRIPWRQRYFLIFPRHMNTGLVYLHYIVQSPIFLQDPIKCYGLTHTRLQLPSNEVLQMEFARVDKSMMYSCWRQKLLKNDRFYCTSGRWWNSRTQTLWSQTNYKFLYTDIVYSKHVLLVSTTTVTSSCTDSCMCHVTRRTVLIF